MTKLLNSFILVLVAVSCAATANAASGQWQSGKMAGLDVLLYVPSTHGQGPSALMLSLHGCAQTPDDLKAYGNWEDAADASNMIVALPKVPNGGKYFGCWDYYGTNHTDRNRDNGPLVALTEQLLAEPTLQIDPRQVYLSGLSAGATEAMNLACLRPDLYAGLGVNSGPVLGTTANDLHAPPKDPQAAIETCMRMAGQRAGYLSTQLISFIVGDRDFMVDPEHSRISAGVFASIYGATNQSQLDLTKLKGANTQGKGLLVSDSSGHPRVSLIVSAGLSHAWAAGADKARQKLFGGSYIATNTIDYPAYLSKFLRENNLRLKGNAAVSE